MPCAAGAAPACAVDARTERLPFAWEHTDCRDHLLPGPRRRHQTRYLHAVAIGRTPYGNRAWWAPSLP